MKKLDEAMINDRVYLCGSRAVHKVSASGFRVVCATCGKIESAVISIGGAVAMATDHSDWGCDGCGVPATGTVKHNCQTHGHVMGVNRMTCHYCSRVL